MTGLRGFADQAAQFATTREDFAHLRANIDRSIDEKRTQSVTVAAAQLVAGHPDAALATMRALYATQYELVTGVRPPLEVAR